MSKHRSWKRFGGCRVHRARTQQCSPSMPVFAHCLQSLPFAVYVFSKASSRYLKFLELVFQVFSNELCGHTATIGTDIREEAAEVRYLHCAVCGGGSRFDTCEIPTVECQSTNTNAL